VVLVVVVWGFLVTMEVLGTISSRVLPLLGRFLLGSWTVMIRMIDRC
jgi:hypothetical protein